jgi:tRNA threonylcarbamoyladenosine biosynthesis protein TsaE
VVVEFSLRTLRDTAKLGARVARVVGPGDLVLVSGDLGVGKTSLVRFAARALGVRERVTSPTFAIMNEYPAEAFSLVHVDLYRLRDGAVGLAGEIARLGLRELRREGAVLFVEWGDDAVDTLGGRPALVVTMSLDPAGARKAALSGPRAGDIV